MITIVDFEDSFTYNIYSCLKECFTSVDIEVVPKARAISRLQTLLSTNKKQIIIFGPGPGHPKEYSEFYQVISDCLQHPHFYVMGICLGHQIIWSLLGLSVNKGNRPVHGQKVIYEKKSNQLTLPELNYPLEVQRYNSLVVEFDLVQIQRLMELGYKFYFDDNELVYASGVRLITYQFHPESIGTYCPAQYFGPLKNELL